MIRSILIDNVRSFFGGVYQFDIRPNTYFCGTNSAGKSTIIKTLLLLRQNLTGSRIGPAGTGQGRLQFNGRDIDLGSYKTFVSNNDDEKTITIGITVDGDLNDETIKFLKDVENGNVNEGTADESGTTEPIHISCIWSFDKYELGDLVEGAEGKVDGVLKSCEIFITHGNERIFNIFVARVENEKVIKDDIKRQYTIYIHKKYFDKIGGSRLMETEEIIGEYSRFKCLLVGLLPENIVALMRRDETENQEGQSQKQQWQTWPLPPHIEVCVRKIRDTIQGVHYLAPLRSPAKRYYIERGNDNSGFDSSGDFLPYVLRDKGSAIVYNARIGDDERAEPFIIALRYWIHYLRTGDKSDVLDDKNELKIDVTGDVLVQIQISSSSGDSRHSLADSGFGFSQVLPIIARGLLARKGSTIVVEQPELHLNPAIQVRLAYFFESLSRCDKGVIVESHSEHLVNSTRVIVAESEPKKKEWSTIHYISSANGSAIVKSLNIDSNGLVPEWPAEFFGEAAALAVRLLKSRSKRR